MAKDVEIKIKWDTKGVKKGAKEAQSGLKGVEKETKLTTEAFSKLGATMTGFFGAQLITKTVTGLAEINKELLAVGVQAQGVVKAFNNIAGSNLDELREATKGTVSDLTLMQSAVKADKFQIPIEKMGSLLKFAGQAAKDTGESVDELAGKISTAIGRKSLLILDDFGITASQIKKELNGMSAEAATVEQLADAVLRIADNSMGNYETTLDTADAYNKLLATIENVKLQGGEMLVDSEDMRDAIDSLTKTIITNAPSILKFITEWGVGAIKIADAMADVAGFVADAFKTEQISEQVKLTKELAKLQREGNQLADVRNKKQKRGVFSETLKLQIAENKELQDKTYKRILYLSNVKGMADEQQKKRDEEEKKRLEELARLKKEAADAAAAAAAGGGAGGGKALKTKRLTEFDDLMGGFNSSLGAEIPASISGMFSPEAMKLSLEENQDLYKELIETTGIKEKEYLDFAKEMDINIDQMKRDAITDEEKRSKERSQMILSTATASINAVNSIVGIVGNESLNAFGKLTGSIGATSGLIDMFAPGVGSLIGAGANLLGGLFGQNEDESTSSSISDVTSVGSSSASSPSKTITRESKNIVNNIYVTNNVGNLMGDEQSQIDLSMMVANNIADIQTSIA